VLSSDKIRTDCWVSRRYTTRCIRLSITPPHSGCRRGVKKVPKDHASRVILTAQMNRWIVGSIYLSYCTVGKPYERYHPPPAQAARRRATGPRRRVWSQMASKIPKSTQGMAMTWFRASAEQEPVVIFSCVLGGLGEAPLSCCPTLHPTPPQEPCASDLLPASTPSLFHRPAQSPPQSKAIRPLFEAAHSAAHICTSQMQYPRPPCTPAPPLPPPPSSPPPPAFTLSPHELPRPSSPGFVMPFLFADGGRSVEEANTSFGYARPPMRPG
jgi:hypothetical protein